MKINANAKINLVLDVVRKRDDGFHDVNMIMQTIDLCDIVTLEKAESEITLSGSDPGLKYDESNLAYKAAKLFYNETKIQGGVKIHLEKNIPVCAGMAGGSSDAAAVLSGLNEIYKRPLEKEKLLELGALLGSDVPYCILKGTAVAKGRGEILEPIADFMAENIVIVKPEIDISTPWAYRELDKKDIVHPKTDLAAEYINLKEREKLYPLFENVFETVVFEEYPEVKKIKEEMLGFGCEAALMSGSGPTVFGIFENRENAKKAYGHFLKKYEKTFLTKTV